ncbi:NB-ARC domain-containing protein [Streptosporangium carneum]|uniref:Tetratricopeptide repeat protein n=1 Tax=Streptosporangium carneum TaxID=47481 RepID=A0A9W6MBB0_9ACTN|nr:NB-ARC domain-containing protein [Streptosporangium carneum]GLK07483.1 hypothetical protein GCM10017600_08880 [Streptosporangium carneum]
MKAAGDRSVAVDRNSGVVATGDSPQIYLSEPQPRAEPRSFSLHPPFGRLPRIIRGREDILHDLLGMLDAPPARPQVLHGLGGCGKTTVALGIARQAWERGHTVAWVSASEPDRLLLGMRELARRLGATEQEIKAAWSGEASPMDLIWDLLNAAARPWLLVFDEADDPTWLGGENGYPDDGTGWIRAGRGGLTLVTTRVSNRLVWGSEADMHPVATLDVQQAGALLMDLAPAAGVVAEALVLAERLGGLPLALTAAGSYLSQVGTGVGLLRPAHIRTFLQYDAALSAGGSALLDQQDERRHRRLVGHTWEMSLDHLEGQGLTQARSLMRLLSCFAVAPLPVAVLSPSASTVRSLEGLIHYGLVDVQDFAEGEGEDPVPALLVHRVVHDVNAAKLAESPTGTRHATWAEAATLLARAAAQAAPETSDGWPWWRLIGVHVAGLLTDLPVEVPQETLQNALRAGLRAYAYMSFSGESDTEAMAESLMARAAVLAADDPTRLAVEHRHTLSVLPCAEKYEVYARGLAAQEAVLGPEHPETLITRHNWVLHAWQHGLMADDVAELETRRLLEARSRVLGPADPYTILTHAELALMIGHRGHSEQAKAEYLQIIKHCGTSSELRDHRFLPNNIRHQLGHVLDEQAQYVEAERAYRSLIHDMEAAESLGGEYLRLRLALARNLREQGRRAESKAEYDAYMALLRELADTPAMLLLQARHEYAEILVEEGALAEAEAEYRAVLAERLPVMVPDDSVVLSERHCLAHCLEAQERYEEAERELAGIAAAFEAILGESSKEARSVRRCHARLLMTMDRLDEAERRYRAVLEDEDDSLSRYRLARILQRRGEFQEAAEHFRSVLAEETARLGAGHSDTLITRLHLAQVRHELGEVSGADAKAECQEIYDAHAGLADADPERTEMIEEVLTLFKDR